MKRWVVFFLFLIGFVKTQAFQKALACASCGSGGDDPLILYPNEDVKYYLGVTRASGFKTISPDGKVGTDGGPQFKDSYQLSVGKSINETAFVTLLLPYLHNRKNGTYKTSAGDPIFSLRWTAWMPNIAEPDVPQVQVLLGYKYAYAKSLYESEYPKSLIDVFGNGFSETRFGLDVFWGMRDFKYGFAHTAQIPTARKFKIAYVEQGLGMRTTALIGYGQSAWGKILFGMNREQRDRLRMDGVLQPDSDSLAYSLFLTADSKLYLPENAMLRLTLSRRALEAMENKNTSRAWALTVAWMQALL